MTVADVLKTKIKRLQGGAAPRVLDLFSGCGGFSLGFKSAGYDLVGAVEYDQHAALSHARNFFPEDLEHHARALDITQLEPLEFVSDLASGDPRLAVDVIIGGPPCQAFARVGRAKLREIAEHPQAFRHDPRAGLYVSYLEFVRQLQPVAIVMENVIDILNHGGRNIPQEMCDQLATEGYECRYTMLNAVHYGVPQMRERLFLVGLRKELGVEPRFPAPTRQWDLPKGYGDARRVALKHVEPSLFTELNLVPAPRPGERLPPAVTAEEAMRDLPPITLHLEGRLKKGPARFTTMAPYRSDVEPSAYGATLRSWPGFESSDGVYDHLIRYLPRDYAIFARMQPGDQYPEAYALAHRMFEEALAERERGGERLQEGSRAYELLKKSIVPGYNPGTFPNRWRKMEADQPARTLMAHLGKDSYTHIHYDSSQARTISIREAARLQSFPDGFVYAGTMNPALRQIGNAVPPLMGRALAECLAGQLASGLSRLIAPRKPRRRALQPA